MLRDKFLIILFLITGAAFTLFLAGCAPYKPNNTKAGMCNELNSRMIFSGSTSNIQNAEIQDASDGLVQRTYDKRCDS